MKADKLNSALVEMTSFAKIKSKTISGEDVTDEYHDYALRLENAEKARARYLELLTKAENVEATLKVEKELERLNLEIDAMKGKLNKLGHLSEYSTIEISIEQKEKLGILGYVAKGAYVSVKWLFVRS